MRKIIISIIFMLALTSCSNTNSIDKISFVEALHIEEENDAYNVTMYIADTTEYIESSDNKYTMETTYGMNIIDAINSFEVIYDKKLDFNHIGHIVLDDSFYTNKKNMEYLFNLFTQYTEISRRANLYTTQEDIHTIRTLLVTDEINNFTDFQETLIELLFYNANYDYVILNYIQDNDEKFNKGTIFSNLEYVDTTDSDYTLGYKLLTEDTENLLLDGNFLIEKFRLTNKYDAENDIIKHNVKINVEGDFVTNNATVSETSQYLATEISKAYTYFREKDSNIFHDKANIMKYNYKALNLYDRLENNLDININLIEKKEI